MKLYHNAKFYSMVIEGDYFSAVLVENGLIKECFSKKPQLLNVEEIDLDGATIFPGFTDSHTHSFEGGLYSLGANLNSATSISEVLELIATSPLVGNYKFAFSLDENQLKERRFPTKDELDKVCPNNPLLVRRVDGHSCVINSKALEIINFGEKLSTDFDGFLNREKNDIAAHTFHNTLTDDAIISSYMAANKIALKSGITTVHTMIGDAQYNYNHFPLIQSNLDKFDIDFILYPQILDVKKAIEVGSKRVGGCILADGSFGSHTAALTQPYSDQPDNSGALYQSDEFWNNFVLDAHQNDLQVGVHCIGDKAIEQIVNAFVHAQKKEFKNLKHQIIHNELMSDSSLELMKKYKISAVMQPMFDKLWGGENGFYSKVIGVDRALKMNRLKTIYDSGVLLAGSSDWYITTLDILEQLQAAISMTNKAEQLSVHEALTIYTKNSALLSNSNNGTIQNGKIADFTLLENDPFVTKSFLNNRVVAVVKRGTLINV